MRRFTVPTVQAGHAIGVDLGGTKILAGVVARDGSVVRRHERPTPQDSQEHVLAELEAAVAELLDDSVEAVGFGAPSPIDQARGGRGGDAAGGARADAQHCAVREGRARHGRGPHRRRLRRLRGPGRVMPGDPVLFRSIYGGHVRWCFPGRYVGDWQGRHGVYCQPGNAGRSLRRSPDGRYLEDWAGGVSPFAEVWEKGPVLRFMRPGDAHTIELCWDPDWRFVCWYVNLQAPLVVHGDRFDSTDWALHVVVHPDGTWRCNEEDEF